MFYEVMGFREGVLVLPNDRPLPIRIDRANMSHDTIPEMNISVLPGSVGRHLIEDYERRQRAKRFLTKPFNFLPDPTPPIKKVIFNDPATIVIWKDDTKTVVKCQPGDTYSKELGLAMCISKKYLGNKGNFNEEFKKWIPEEPIEIREDIPIDEMIKVLEKACIKSRCSECIFKDDNCDIDELEEKEIKEQYYRLMREK
jgi:hypothetical protein